MPGAGPIFSTISIHALREEGDPGDNAHCRRRGYFYPRPPRGGRQSQGQCLCIWHNFYPRPPRGGRLTVGDPSGPESVFLSTPSARRATYIKIIIHNGRSISIHALREEGDGFMTALTWWLTHFYPRPPRGGRRPTPRALPGKVEFLSTPSARRATAAIRAAAKENGISIHALREEGDPQQIAPPTTCTGFLSTPSARRATVLPSPARGEVEISIHALREEGDRQRPYLFSGGNDFYPRPPRGGRPAGLGFQQLLRDISIHALREEGDDLPRLVQQPAGEFLSTPSARRATKISQSATCCSMISIHALREEGDKKALHNADVQIHFYPRPPRGGRRVSEPRDPGRIHFYPRPPRGGRPSKTQGLRSE